VDLGRDYANASLKLLFAYSILAHVCTLLLMRYWKRRGLKEKSDAQGPDPGSTFVLFRGSLQ
jgi:hypothetical protein